MPENNGPKTNLYLIRHGEAVSNVEPIIGGMRGDVGLTALGIAQAERLRDRLAATHEIPADVLIASNLPRARQTAEIIQPALGVPVRLDESVQEMRPGDADGMRLDEFKARYGIPDFRRDPFRPLATNGENWPAFMLRVGEALDRITHVNEGQSIVVVSHGGVIEGSFAYFMGLPTLAAPRIDFFPHNTSITHWQRRKRADDSYYWRLVAYNDVLHLRDLGTPDITLWEEMATHQPQVGHDEPSVPLPPRDSKR